MSVLLKFRPDSTIMANFVSLKLRTGLEEGPDSENMKPEVRIGWRGCATAFCPSPAALSFPFRVWSSST